MPRVNTVKKCRKSPGSCTKCGAKIPTGQPYVWWQFAYSSKTIRCSSPGCAPKASDLTRSEFYQTLYGIQEGLDYAIQTFREDGDGSALGSALEGSAEEIRNLGEECREKYDNMPEGLQQGDTGQLLEERADACEIKADEWDVAANEFDSYEEYEDIERFLLENPLEREEGETDEEYTNRAKEAMNRDNEEKREAALIQMDIDTDLGI